MECIPTSPTCTPVLTIRRYFRSNKYANMTNMLSPKCSHIHTTNTKDEAWHQFILKKIMFIQSQMVKSRTTIKDMIQKWTDGQTVKLGKVENTLRDTEGPQNWTERKENTSNEDKLGGNERWGVKRTTQRHIRSMRQEQNGEERQDGRGSEWEAETGQQAKESRQEQSRKTAYYSWQTLSWS